MVVWDCCGERAVGAVVTLALERVEASGGPEKVGTKVVLLVIDG